MFKIYRIKILFKKISMDIPKENRIDLSNRIMEKVEAHVAG